MRTAIGVCSLLGLGLVVLTVASCAEELRKGAIDGKFFDVSSAVAFEIPAAEPLVAIAAKIKPTSQSGRDLYYFTPEEATIARRVFGAREQAMKGGLAFNTDVPTDIQAQMRRDMAFIAGIRGGAGSPLHREIFGPVDGSTYSRFFRSRVGAIGMDDCGSPKAVACVIPLRDPSKMWLTRNFIGFDHPQIARLMIVFHEARHTETRNGNWPHAICPVPFLDENGRDRVSIWTGATLAGEPACDMIPFGSYGSSTIMLKNIQRFCTNCTDKIRMDAGLYADDQIGRIIDADARSAMEQDLGQ